MVWFAPTEFTDLRRGHSFITLIRYVVSWVFSMCRHKKKISGEICFCTQGTPNSLTAAHMIHSGLNKIFSFKIFTRMIDSYCARHIATRVSCRPVLGGETPPPPPKKKKISYSAPNFYWLYFLPLGALGYSPPQSPSTPPPPKRWNPGYVQGIIWILLKNEDRSYFLG